VAFCKWLSRRHGRTGAQEFRVLTEAEHHAMRGEPRIMPDLLTYLLISCIASVDWNAQPWA
jgi:predicted xylose isomerase-like sugar epimerase